MRTCRLPALDVLLHTVKATCEGLIEAVANSPHVHHDDGDDEGPRVVARLQAVIEEIDGAPDGVPRPERPTTGVHQRRRWHCPRTALVR